MKAYKTSQGNWQLNFTFEGKQRTLYLGRGCTDFQANGVAKVVDELLTLRRSGGKPKPDLLSEVGTLPGRVRSSLERFGLLRCCFGISIVELYDRYLESKSYRNRKTMENYAAQRRLLVLYFGADCSVSSLSVQDVQDFVCHLSSILAKTTLYRYIKGFKTVFKFAVEEGFIADNPFSVKVGYEQVNEQRQSYVSRDMSFRLLSFFRNDRERLAFVLGRFGGLRVPSEVLELRFKDFDLKEKVLRVSDNTKTGFREVPFFREIQDIFVTLKGDPEDFVFDGWTKSRFCSFMEVAIRKAGMEQWPKLWVNLRSSLITDLEQMGYTEKTLDSIFGNSASVRKLHYIQFERRKAYQKVLADNEKLCCGVSVTKSLEGTQQEFDLLLQEVRLLRKLLVEGGISPPNLPFEKKM